LLVKKWCDIVVVKIFAIAIASKQGRSDHRAALPIDA
jgi:hypothetical protein